MTVNQYLSKNTDLKTIKIYNNLSGELLFDGITSEVNNTKFSQKEVLANQESLFIGDGLIFVNWVILWYKIFI